MVEIIINPQYNQTYEAYLYRFTNLSNGKMYIGIHKGYVGDGYWHSSKNKEFRKAFSDSSILWKYEVLDFGTY